MKKGLPVAIIGGGPVGLAAAAHLLINENDFVLLESGPAVGHNILDWGHVRMFSPWKFNIDRAARQLLDTHGIPLPDENELPTGQDLVKKYLIPLATIPAIKEKIRLNSRVISVGRNGMDKVKSPGRRHKPFVLTIESDEGRQQIEARAVIDTSGTWNTPNPIGSGGYQAEGEDRLSDKISYRIPDITHADRHRYTNKSVAVIGSGHSAINSLLDLVELREKHPATVIHWIMRKRHVTQTYGGKSADALAARGALGERIQHAVERNLIHVHTPVHIHKMEESNGAMIISGRHKGEAFRLTGIHEIICNTGARPDFSFLRELRYQVDPSLESVPALAPLIDPNVHSCGSVPPHGELELRQPEEDFYIAGVKSYGRAPTFLLATGYEQVRSIVAYINGDEEAARRVELVLPETGVCSAEKKSSGAPESVLEKKETFRPLTSIAADIADGCCGASNLDANDSCC